MQWKVWVLWFHRVNALKERMYKLELHAIWLKWSYPRKCGRLCVKYDYYKWETIGIEKLGGETHSVRECYNGEGPLSHGARDKNGMGFWAWAASCCLLEAVTIRRHCCHSVHLFINYICHLLLLSLPPRDLPNSPSIKN